MLHTALHDKIGHMPLGVPWFGAVGAVIISLSGAVYHRSNWDPSWNLWHYCRPLIGATMAIVSWLILQSGILAVGVNPDKTVTGTPANILYYLVAFVVGYREDVFRSLIKRVADVILTPGRSDRSGTPVIKAINPATGGVAGNETVTITGSGLSDASDIRFGTASATNISVVSDGEITVSTPAGSAGPVTVTVTTKAGKASGEFTYI